MPKQTKVTPPPETPEYPVTILVHTDQTGVIGQFLCPNCGQLVRVSQHGRQPGQRCGCGLEYQLAITARPVVGPSEIKG